MSDTVGESAGDGDLGSGGAMVLPDLTDGSGQTRHLVVGAGKDAHIYLADRDNLGKFFPSNNATLYQDVVGALASGVFAAPAYFNGQIYYGAAGDALKGFTLTNARLSTAATSQSAQIFGYPGATPSVSANGTADGIVWATRNTNPGSLYAFDAGNLGTQLYSTNDAPNGCDNLGPGNKFITPTVANGKVYVGSTSSVGVFGLFNPPGQ